MKTLMKKLVQKYGSRKKVARVLDIDLSYVYMIGKGRPVSSRLKTVAEKALRDKIK